MNDKTISKGSTYLGSHDSTLQFAYIDLAALPVQVLTTICLELDPKSLRSVFRVCKAFHNIYQNNSFWYYYSKNRFSVADDWRGRNWRDYYAETTMLHRTGFQLVLSERAMMKTVSPRMHHTTNLWRDQLVVVGGEGRVSRGLGKNINYGDIFLIKQQETPESLLDEVISIKTTPDKTKVDEYTNEYWKVSKQSVSGKPITFSINGHSSNVVGDKLYIFGGLEGDPPKKTNNMYILDLPTMSWKTAEVRGEPPSARCDFGSVQVGKSIYIFGGSDAKITPQNDLYRFDTDTLSWERIQASGRLPPPRSAHQMSAIGDRLYMFGGGSWVSGTDWEKLFPSIFMLDTRTMFWIEIENKGVLPTMSTFPGSFTNRNHIWIIGGGSRVSPQVSNECFVYDTVTHIWKKNGFLNMEFQGRDALTVTPMNEKAAMFGGNSGVPLTHLQFIRMDWETKYLQEYAKNH